MPDTSNGYDDISKLYLQQRGNIGAATVSTWAKSFSPGATVMDVGCGTGMPVTKILLEAGLHVFAIDASPNMITIVNQQFPEVTTACEAAEESLFFQRLFDGIIAVGLIFLLPEESQRTLIAKMVAALQPGGTLLFTAPLEKVMWEDILTGRPSRSLGAKEYSALLSAAGISVIKEFEDEGGNNYFYGVK